MGLGVRGRQERDRGEGERRGREERERGEGERRGRGREGDGERRRETEGGVESYQSWAGRGGVLARALVWE